MAGMEQCVTPSGTMKMPLWCADNWDFLLMVNLIVISFVNTITIIIVSLPGAINLTHEEFTSNVTTAAITDVDCTGIENQLTDCSYSSQPLCSPLDDAGVVCQGILSEYN